MIGRIIQKEWQLFFKRLDVAWGKNIRANNQNLNEHNIEKILQEEIGRMFSTVLEHAGVYKRTPEGKRAFWRFMDKVKQ
ncbi:hypothetical protein [Thalassobacillus cyri]|uniref:hypothetical protein n=1 Tax=Thalassobacillus cyri TaxID=571932 RepID=UPI000ACA1125|nr:hypothetical protein [Thalassobacillus cyri]